MSKKKKDKSDDPKKTKASSSKKASQQPSADADRKSSITEFPVTPKPRRAVSIRKKSAVEISADDIALRAYYIAEHRRGLSLPGDELGDWVEAERQLRKEAGSKST